MEGLMMIMIEFESGPAHTRENQGSQQLTTDRQTDKTSRGISYIYDDDPTDRRICSQSPHRPVTTTEIFIVDRTYLQ